MTPITSDIVIDLGVPSEEPGAEQEPSPSRHTRRWATLSAAAIAVLVCVTGSGVPRTSERDRVLSIAVGEGVSTRLAWDTVFVCDHGTVTAYRIADATALWQVLTGFTEILDVEVAAGTAVLSGAMAASPLASTVAVDAATGRTLWTRDGLVIPNTNSDITVVQVVDPPSLMGVDRRTGAHRWRLEEVPGTVFWPSWMRSPAQHAVSTLFAWRPDHTLATISLDAGVVTHQGTLPVGVPDAVIGDTVFSWTQPLHAETGELSRAGFYTAYDLSTFTELVRLPMDEDNRLIACGTLVCRFGRDAAVLDPRTGRTIWQSPVGEIRSVWRRHTGEMIVTSVFESSLHLQLIDPGSGQIVYNAPNGWTYAADTPDNLLVLLPTNDHDDQAWVGRIPAIGPLEIIPIAPIGEARGDYYCAAAQRLICFQPDHILLIRV
jgi:outer membrane protein assembly factor BamB